MGNYICFRVPLLFFINSKDRRDYSRSGLQASVVQNSEGFPWCIEHMVRNSLNYVYWKMRAEVAADLKRIYQSATADEAEQRLVEFEGKWDGGYRAISESWRRNWPRITPFFDYPPEIRKVI